MFKIDNRYPDDSIKQAAYENACWDIYYGCNRGYWKRMKHNQELPEDESNEVWHNAWTSMAEQTS